MPTLDGGRNGGGGDADVIVGEMTFGERDEMELRLGLITAGEHDGDNAPDDTFNLDRCCG